MRRVTLAARRASSYLRRPPRPRWFRPALWAGIALLGLAGSSGAAVWATRSGALTRAGQGLAAEVLDPAADAGLALREVYVEGRVRTRPDALRAQLGIRIGQPILGFDTRAARLRLEQLPWVEQASVERMLPGALQIRLVERQPLALWQRDGHFVLIDRDGAVIEAPSADLEAALREAHLRVLVGDRAPRHAAALFALLSTEPALSARVVAATWVGDRRWTLQLDNRVDVLLPENDAGTAWHLLGVRARQDALLDRAIREIDLRLLPGRIRLRLDPSAVEGQGA